MRYADADHQFGGKTKIDPEETLGGRIVYARETLGLSTAQLARRIGVKTATLQAWESDRSEPRSNRLVMLASMLNVSPAWLLVGAGDTPLCDAAAPGIDDVKSALVHLQRQSMATAEEIGRLVARLDDLELDTRH